MNNKNTLYDIYRFIDIMSYRISRKFNLDRYDTRQDCWVSYLENKNRLDMNNYGWKKYIIKCFYNDAILKLKRSLNCVELKDNYEECDIDYENLYEKWSLIFHQKKIINKLLNDVTNKQKNVLSLYYGLNNRNELNSSEVSKVLNCTKDNVKKMKRLALKRLNTKNNSKLIKQYL